MRLDLTCLKLWGFWRGGGVPREARSQLCQPSLIYYSFNEEIKDKQNKVLDHNHHLRLTLLYGHRISPWACEHRGAPRR